MKVAIGSDHHGYAMKEDLKEFMASQGLEVVDCGCFSTEAVDYPDIAVAVAECVSGGQADRGILVCGTGIGMAMAANKVKGIRAAQCPDVYSAERAAKSNNAHIITLGARVLGPEIAKVIVKTWLESEFGGGPSQKKIDKIMALE